MKLDELKKHIDDNLNKIKKANEEKLKDVKTFMLGRQGLFTKAMESMRDLSPKEKPSFGQKINELKIKFVNALNKRQEEIEIEKINELISNDFIDVSLPTKIHQSGSRHILNTTIKQVVNIFMQLGYRVIDGPEVEYDLYNFEMLNIPKEHPARDMQDTFYFDENKILRTQTSPMQIREMLKVKNKDENLAIIAPGNVFRRDIDDQTHSHQFMQIEGLMIGKNISMGHLKGTLDAFSKEFFGKDREIKFRSSFFPFTEPSVEVDVMCGLCKGQGCFSCHNAGWIEVLGAGMVHPTVLQNGGYDPKIYSGFAFAFGVDRLTMLKHDIKDIRYFYNGDVNVLKQFKGDN